MTINGIAMEVKGNKLVIEVDISKEALKKAPLSKKTGKNKVIGTGGFVAVGDFKVGLNVLAKP